MLALPEPLNEAKANDPATDLHAESPCWQRTGSSPCWCIPRPSRHYRAHVAVINTSIVWKHFHVPDAARLVARNAAGAAQLALAD